MNQRTINIFGYKINVPENKTDISVTKRGWCMVDVNVPRGTIAINTELLPKAQCSADYFIQEFNNQLNAVLK